MTNRHISAAGQTVVGTSPLWATTLIPYSGTSDALSGSPQMSFIASASPLPAPEASTCFCSQQLQSIQKTAFRLLWTLCLRTETEVPTGCTRPVPLPQVRATLRCSYSPLLPAGSGEVTLPLRAPLGSASSLSPPLPFQPPLGASP